MQNNSLIRIPTLQEATLFATHNVISHYAISTIQ